MKAPIRPKATITAGIVMCSICKCECKLEIPAEDVKIDEQSVRQEADQIRSLNKPVPKSYGPFSLKEGLKDSFGIFHRLSDIKNSKRQVFPWKTESMRVEDRQMADEADLARMQGVFLTRVYPARFRHVLIQPI